MPKAAKEEQEEGSPAWILSYADLTQQLLCMFVLFFSMMKMDVAKAQAVLQAFAPGPPTKQAEGDLMTTYPSEHPEIFTIGAKREGPVEGTNLLMQRVNEGMKITIQGTYFFEEGQSEISENMKKMLKKIAEEFLRGRPNVVEIRGFTSTAPGDSINGDYYLLSYWRAKNTADFFTADPNFKIDPIRLRITACGINNPVADNLVEKYRALNRRIEVIVSEELVESK